MNKKFLLILLFILLLPLVFSATISKEEIKKGEIFEIRGKCFEEVFIKITQKEKQIISTSAKCDELGFRYKYVTSFSDPSGIWKIEVNDENFNINVLPSRESGFLVIAFLSPTKEIMRANPFEISVKVTENSLPVKNARVWTWTINGEKIKLNEIENGIYSYKGKTPFDSSLGNWNILVIAEKEDGKAGGEEELKVNITKAYIESNFVSPILTSFDFGTEISVIVKATYADGSSLVNPRLKLTANEEQSEFKQISKNTFETTFYQKEEQFGDISLEVDIIDGGNNKGKIRKQIILYKGWQYYLKKYLIFVVLGIFIILAFFYAFKWTRKTFDKKSKVLEEKKEIEKKLEKLQKDYFEKASISKENYNSQYSILKQKLSETERDISLATFLKEKQHKE